MKKITMAFIMVLCSFSLFAKQLPSGINAPVSSVKEEEGVIVYAKLAADTDIETSVGIIHAAANSELYFYPSGALKSVFTTKKSEVVTPVGKFVISSFSRLSTVIPISFYENGNLEKAFLPAINEKNYPADINYVECPLGKVPARTENYISFNSDGSVYSFKLSKDYLVGENLTLANSSRVAFHSNGRLAEATFKEGIIYGNTKSKPKTAVTYSPEGRITSFIPDANSYLELGDIAFFYKSGEPIQFYDNGNYKSFIIEVAGKDFSIMGYNIYCQSDKEVINSYDEEKYGKEVKPSVMYLTCEFYDNGYIKGFSTDSSEKTFIFQFGSQFVKTNTVEFYDNGGFKSLRLLPELLTNGDTAGSVFSVGKFSFSPDQQSMARIGVMYKGSASSFYGSQAACIVFNNGQEKIVDDRIISLSDVIWDENNKAVAYTSMSPITAEDPNVMILKEIK